MGQFAAVQFHEGMAEKRKGKGDSGERLGQFDKENIGPPNLIIHQWSI